MNGRKDRLEQVFGVKRPVIGMVHLHPLPGNVGYSGSMEAVLEQALADVRALKTGGVHGYLIENAGGSPFHIGENIDVMEPIAVCHIATILSAEVNLPFGFNIACNGVKQAIAVAKVCGGSFVRATGWVNGYYSSSGFVAPCAPDCVDYKRKIEADDVMVWADIKMKNGSHSFLQDKTLEAMGKDAFSAMADAVILTGTSTGIKPDIEELRRMYEAVSGPVIIGSGAAPENLSDLMPFADAFIIGTFFKEHKRMMEPVMEEKVRQFMECWNKR